MDHQPTDIDPRVAALLADPATYGLDPDTKVTRFDTHASAVFLAGDRALKVKRPVRYSYLDYSTLLKREAACRAELDVNAPFASALYRGVVAITRDPAGTLELGGNGEAVEWAVEMRRFDETLTLDHLADAGELPASLIQALAEDVVAGHARTPEVDAEAWFTALTGYAADNRTAFQGTPELFPAADALRLATLTEAELAQCRGLILDRGRHGLVRHCHGDLHLGNVALVDGRPLPFDAIEFDPLIASGDVLYELAFLLMDLLARGRAFSATLLLNQYLFATGRDDDLDALKALPLFLSMRAQIRAKVAAARRGLTTGSAAAAATSDSGRYFRLALKAITPPHPHLLIVAGLSGTGKSSVAHAVAGRLPPLPGALIERSDVERKRLYGVALTDRLPAAAYTPEFTAKVYRRLATRTQRALEASHSVVVDAVFAKPEERAEISALGAACGVPARGIWLEAPLKVRLARVASRHGDASDADARVIAMQEELETGPLDWPRINADGPLDVVVERAFAALDDQ
ncbi:MAG: AAA family ATPase [Methylacidiphilales bacterium]|nr:AAA family ATPase [Candidatus Methylacidiphilales bacterium]